MGQYSGSKKCEGGCGRPISATRRWCLRCVAAIVRETLARRGTPATKEEVMRALLEQT